MLGVAISHLKSSVGAFTWLSEVVLVSGGADKKVEFISIKITSG